MVVFQLFVQKCNQLLVLALYNSLLYIFFSNTITSVKTFSDLDKRYKHFHGSQHFVSSVWCQRQRFIGV